MKKLRVPARLRPRSKAQTPQHSSSPNVPTAGKTARAVELDAGRPSMWANQTTQDALHEEQRQRAEQLRAEQREREYVQSVERQNLLIAEQKERAEAEERRYKRDQNASVGCVRHLRGLMREKYRLDIYVWSMREVQKADREIIEKDCAKADAILQEIYFIVNAWEEDQFEPEEWKIANKIKDNLTVNASKHAIWGDLPPWDRHVNGETS